MSDRCFRKDPRNVLRFPLPEWPGGVPPPSILVKYRKPHPRNPDWYLSRKNPSKYKAPPGELPFTAEEETIIDDLSIHHDTLSQIHKILESQPGSSPTSIANIIGEICKLSQELSDPSTNPPDVPEHLEAYQLGDDTLFLQPDTPGQDVINSTLEALGKVLEIKKPAPTSNESSTPQVTEPLTTGLPSTSTAGPQPTTSLDQQAPKKRGLKKGPTPSCFAGLKPEFQGQPFNCTINGFPQSSLAETLRTLQGIPWVSPQLTDTPTGSNSPAPCKPKEGS
jgi:hypothetical protein